MITGEIKSQIDRIWNAFWSGGIANPWRSSGRSRSCSSCAEAVTCPMGDSPLVVVIAGPNGAGKSTTTPSARR
jgi:hypothetical protein